MAKKQIISNKNRTLISIVSNRDPYFQTLLNNTEQSVPLLALLSAERFHNLILLSQPVFKTNAEKTKIYDFNVNDPINYIEIIKEMRKTFSYKYVISIMELDLTSPEFPIVHKNFTFKFNSQTNIKDIQTNIQQLEIIAHHQSIYSALKKYF